MAIRAVVFDLDGTLVEFNLDYKSARAEVIQFLSTQGFPQSLFSIKESVFEMLKKVEISMKNNGKDLKELAGLRQAVLTLLEKYELESASSTRPLPGVFETLKALKKAGLKLALFTVNGQKSVNYVLETLRLKEFFSAIITRNSVPSVKPNPVHLETVLEALKVKPDEAIVVGDSIWDMKSAQELGAFAVGATTGVSSPEELTRAGANCLVSSPTDLVVLVEQLNKRQSVKDIETS